MKGGVSKEDWVWRCGDHGNSFCEKQNPGEPGIVEVLSDDKEDDFCHLFTYSFDMTTGAKKSIIPLFTRQM
jgi:hypothetical protein